MTLALIGVIVALAVAGETTSQLRFDSQSGPLSAGGGVTVLTTGEVSSGCASLNRLYRADHAQVLVDIDPVINYSCAAIDGINTLYPGYDRRYWLIDQATTRRVTRVLLQAGLISCSAIPRAAGRCATLSQANSLLITPPRPLAETLGLLHIALWDGPKHPNIAG